MKWLGPGVMALALVPLLIGFVNYQRLSGEFDATSPEVLASQVDSSVFPRIEYTCPDDFRIEYQGVITAMHGELSWDEANELEETLDEKLDALIARTRQVIAATDEIGITAHDVDGILKMSDDEAKFEAAMTEALVTVGDDLITSREPYLNERADLKILLPGAAKHGWTPEEQQPCTTAMVAGGIFLALGLGLTILLKRWA